MILTPPSLNGSRCTPLVGEEVVLYHSAMINKFIKLVAVAEAMAAGWEESGMDVQGVEVMVEGVGGVVKIGNVEVTGSYCPDDNVVHPIFYVDYKSHYFTWVDNEWVRDEPISIIKEAMSPFGQNEEFDELPF